MSLSDEWSYWKTNYTPPTPPPPTTSVFCNQDPVQETVVQFSVTVVTVVGKENVIASHAVLSELLFLLPVNLGTWSIWFLFIYHGSMDHVKKLHAWLWFSVAAFCTFPDHRRVYYYFIIVVIMNNIIDNNNNNKQKRIIRLCCIWFSHLIKPPSVWHIIVDSSQLWYHVILYLWNFEPFSEIWRLWPLVSLW